MYPMLLVDILPILMLFYGAYGRAGKPQAAATLCVQTARVSSILEKFGDGQSNHGFEDPVTIPLFGATSLLSPPPRFPLRTDLA